MKKKKIKMLCWLKLSNSHGLVGYEPIWLPKGDEPEIDREKYSRAPWLDGEINE